MHITHLPTRSSKEGERSFPDPFEGVETNVLYGSDLLHAEVQLQGLKEGDRVVSKESGDAPPSDELPTVLEEACATLNSRATLGISVLIGAVLLFFLNARGVQDSSSYRATQSQAVSSEDHILPSKQTPAPSTIEEQGGMGWTAKSAERVTLSLTHGLGSLFSGKGTSINIKDHGAKGDGTTIDTDAINSALRQCSGHTRCQVVFPSPGNYLTGQIYIDKHGVTLYIEKGATLQFHAQVDLYPHIPYPGKYPTRFQP